MTTIPTPPDPGQPIGWSPGSGRPIPPPAYTMVRPKHGLAVAALVCGIVGSVVGLIPLFGLFAVALGLVALTLGGIAWHTGRQVGVKQGRAGFWLGALSLTLGIIGMVIVNDAVNDLGEDLENIGVDEDYVPPTMAEINEASTDQLWTMWTDAPGGSDSETRIENELRSRGEM